MGRLLRRVLAGALAALLLTGFLVTVTESPAAARKVGNAGGGFSIRVHAGDLSIGDQGFEFIDEGRVPQCQDGSNNDGTQDSAVDFPADGQCTSATDDSETQPGFQAKLPIQMTNGTVSSTGAYSFPAANVSFPTQYMYVDVPPDYEFAVSDFIVTLNITALSPATGTINPLTGAMTLDLSVRVDADGGPLAANCAVTPINITGATTGTTAPPGPNTPISGVPYNQTTGRMTLVQNSFSVPGASNCGTVAVFVSLDDQINSQLGLPSAAGRNSASFLAEWTPTKPTPGVTASFTATPSSGTAPLLVSVNAGASTGVGLTYGWDFTNNGSIDATGVTATNLYLTAGTHTARLRVTDSDGDFVDTTRLITVGANQPPVADDQTQSTPEDTAKAITLSGTDPEGGALTYTLVAPNPLHGTLTGTLPNLTYTPAANYNGPDSFGFRVTDPVGNFDNGTVTLNVTPVNDLPSASNVSATLLEDTPGPVTLIATDIDGTPLTYAIVTPPTKGVLSSGTGASRTYTPNANEHGVDTFTYEASDGTATSNLATGTITITPVNDAPVADDQVGANAVSTTEDTPVGITLTGSDLDGTGVTFGIVDPPDHGTLTGILPNLTYTPAANYNGPDTLIFKVTDPSGASDNGQVDLSVAPANDAPTTGNVSVGTLEDTPVDVTIPSNDIDGDPLTFTPSTPTAGAGAVSCAGSLCTYTPATGFVGADSFTVDVSDGTATVTSTVTVNVSALNNAAPVINDATIVGLEDSVRSFNLVSADADGDPRTHTVLVPPASGNLTCSAAGACTFVPAANANGVLTALVQVSDGQGGVDTATITLTIVPINDAPVVPAQSLTTAEDTVGLLDLVASDVDADTVTWTVKVAPAKGSLTCTPAGACSYTPQANVHGSDSFEVEADDGHGARVRITVPVTISPVDDPPTAGTVNRSVAEDGSTTFALVGADDGGSVTFAASPAASGSLSCSSAGACTFMPTANVNGTETVAYTVSDGASSTTGAIVLTIVPANDAPVAVSQTLSTPEDVPLAVTLAGSDPDVGDALTFQVTSAPAQGLLGGTAPNLTYVPAPNASGTVALSYKVTDAAGLSSTAIVTILVTPVDDAPIANGASVTTPEDTAKGIVLSGSDAEGPVTVAVTAPPGHGTYSAGVYTPALNYNGPDAIGFTVTSGTGQVANGTIAITITPVNDPPVATDATVSTTRTVPVAITLGGTDVDGPGTLTYAVLTGPTKGTLSGTAPNLTYTPTGFNTGSDTVTFKVTDSSGATDSGTIGITITAGPALATQIAVAPATVTKPGGLLGFLYPYSYPSLKGTLTTVGTNLPVAGVTVAFTVNGTHICTGTTNASGLATCTGTGPRVNATTYQAAFAGNAGFAASTGTGSLS